MLQAGLDVTWPATHSLTQSHSEQCNTHTPKKGKSNQFRYHSVCFQNPIVTVLTQCSSIADLIIYAATLPN